MRLKPPTGTVIKHVDASTPKNGRISEKALTFASVKACQSIYGNKASLPDGLGVEFLDYRFVGFGG
jgi:hypothetical protein